MTDVVINQCYGGFGLSDEAEDLYAKKSGFQLFRYRQTKHGHDDGYWWSRKLDRDDPVLVEVVRELGDRANGPFASLSVVSIPDGVSWEIDEYDGFEHVAETHRTWG